MDITIIGTSHIAKESVQTIRMTIESKRPDIVAVELDKHRLVSLLQEQKTSYSLSHIGRIGLKGYLFAIVAGYIQKKLGKIVGVMPGADMLAAVKAAKKHRLQLALIDQDINITLRKFSQAFTWREKWHIVVDIFNGIVFKKREFAKLGISHLDISKVPSHLLIRKLLARMKDRYPSIYQVLVFERNHIMAQNLVKIMHKFPDKSIVAVVGAGHEEDIKKLLKKYQEGKIDVVT